MAIDTRNKRASTIGIGFHVGKTGPAPDGSIANAADRQQIGYGYPGIAAAGAPTGRIFRLAGYGGGLVGRSRGLAA